MDVRQIGPSEEHVFSVANKEQVVVDPLTQVAVGIIEEGHLEGNEEMPPPIQQHHQVAPEPLQQSVHETKTKERRLVFDTLKGVTRKVINSYENMDVFKSRLEKEIHRANPELSKEEIKEFVGGLDLQGNPSLGDKLVQGHEERTLGESIQQVRDDAVGNRGLFSSHSCFKYIMNHFEQFWGAFTSQKIGSPLGDYDPHGSLGNNAGALYEETLDVDGVEGKALDVRTPSPTIGGRVSPEFKAALQAIENQRISESLGEEGYGRPNCWIYTNYQEMTNEWNGEHGRSKAIMRLNDEFPLSFKGITLSKDSNYYKEGLGHGEGERLWESIDHDSVFNSDSIPDFVQEMKEMFTNDSHFTLSNRTKDKGEKLYFPAKTPKEVEEYKAELEKIAELTGDFLREVLKDNQFQGKDAWMVKAAAKEFAWAAVQKLVQAKELQKMKAQGITPSVITTSACKEDIDRGFSDHIKRMYMLGAGDESFLAKIVNLPALMARYRVILNDRIQPLIGVVTHVDREVAKEHLDQVTQGLGVSSRGAKVLHQSEE